MKVNTLAKVHLECPQRGLFSGTHYDQSLMFTGFHSVCCLINVKHSSIESSSLNSLHLSLHFLFPSQNDVLYVFLFLHTLSHLPFLPPPGQTLFPHCCCNPSLSPGSFSQSLFISVSSYCSLSFHCSPSAAESIFFSCCLVLPLSCIHFIFPFIFLSVFAVCVQFFFFSSSALY